MCPLVLPDLHFHHSRMGTIIKIFYNINWLYSWATLCLSVTRPCVDFIHFTMGDVSTRANSVGFRGVNPLRGFCSFVSLKIPSPDWISYTIVCFRPEDGLRCRQGVKPPLKLKEKKTLPVRGPFKYSWIRPWSTMHNVLIYVGPIQGRI